MRRSWLILVVGALVAALVAPAAGAVEPPPGEGVGVVDPTTGIWYLRDPGSGATTSFYYGNPADEPFMGDWDCDGVDTPGLYRRSDGYVYLRNSNTQGIADIAYYFGNPGDVPLAGDFDGDGCDTVSLYRPSQGVFYVIDRLGSGDEGLGKADTDYVFGSPDLVPFVADFDGDGVDTFGMHDRETGAIIGRNSHTGGPPDVSFSYGNRLDRVLAGDWTGAGTGDVVGLYRPSAGTFFLSDTTPPGVPIESYQFGGRVFIPIAGSFGELPGGSAEPVNQPYLVSTYTTYHPAGQDRNININLMADMVDGAVVGPGETFSLNDHVGERTIEKGFVPAGAIIGGKVYCCDHPANIGGGTSQFATTLYNAVFFGGYEDVYHRPHSLYFSRYPVVREATLSYPGPDLVFRNDTVWPLTIRTGHTATAVTVEIWGDNQGRTVDTVTIGSATPSSGGTATVYRTVVEISGSYRVESWTHTYKVPVEDD